LKSQTPNIILSALTSKSTIIGKPHFYRERDNCLYGSGPFPGAIHAKLILQFFSEKCRDYGFTHINPAFLFF